MNNYGYEGQRSQSLGQKIKEYIEIILTSIMNVLSSLRKREIKLNNRNLQIQKQLGEGGFSFVYLVKDKQTSMLYALKRINCQYEEQGSLVKKEIASHKLVPDSNHVLKLLDSKVVMNQGRIVEGLLLLPFYKKGTAQDLISRKLSGDTTTGLPLATITSIGLDICTGLGAFHSLNPPMAFRDLKPANVLIDDYDRAILMDLGSVSNAMVRIKSRKEAMALQELCAETCTAPYRAPELFDPSSDCTVSQATDIWSLGCTLYALAYGDSPFDGSLSSALGTIRFPPSSSYGEGFEKLIKEILQTNPESRPNLAFIVNGLEKLSKTDNFSANRV